jgi:8-amino-7-oxononanoate synthase
MSDRFASLERELETLRERGRRRQLVPRSVRGIRLVDPGGRETLNFGSNDYLGIAAGGPASVEAVRGGMASSLVCGWTDRHEALARSLAAFEQTETAVLFPTGFAAGSGVVATLPRAGDWILSDQLNHASLIDGCRLSRAERLVFPHRDVGFVEQALREQRQRFEQAWIVTDGVFSMDGHLAPLPELCDLADRYDAILIVDEAHGTGVLGAGGRGACEALGVESRVPIRIGTLSKALGSQGGFIAGPQVVCDYLINRCRPLIYSTSLAPAAVELAGLALEIIRREPQRREHLARLARTARQLLGLDAENPIAAGVPIVSIELGDDRRATDVSRGLAEAGFFVPAIRPPTVPEGTSRLRISLSAAHEEAMLRSLVSKVRQLGG